MAVEYGNCMMENSLTHTHNQQKSKLWCCANSAIELVDTVKKRNTQTNENKRIKQLPETTQQMVVEIFLQNRKKEETKLRRHKSRSDWEISPKAGEST